MNLPENFRLAISMLLVVLVGVAYYTLTEIIDRELVPALIDQGAYVFGADNPSAAMGRWNFISYLFSIVTSACICAIVIIVFAHYGNWMETLPAVITAATFYGIAFSRQSYRPYPLSYDVIELLVLVAALPLWFVGLQSLLKKLHGNGAA